MEGDQDCPGEKTKRIRLFAKLLDAPDIRLDIPPQGAVEHLPVKSLGVSAPAAHL